MGRPIRPRLISVPALLYIFSLSFRFTSYLGPVVVLYALIILLPGRPSSSDAEKELEKDTQTRRERGEGEERERERERETNKRAQQQQQLYSLKHDQ